MTPTFKPFARTALAAVLALGTPLAFAQLGATVGASVDAVGTALSDTAITGKIKTRIATEALLDKSDVSVDTVKGVATLTGTVASTAAKAAAEKLVAATDGVTRVNNQLVVGARTDMSTTSSTSTRTSAGVNADVRADTGVRTSTGSNNAMGTPSGGLVERRTDTTPDRNDAALIRTDGSATAAVGATTRSSTERVGTTTDGAMDTTGRVINDSWISTKVKSQLLADTLTEGSKITVKTKKKVVYLTGTAKSQAEKDQAIALAKATEGVKRVDSKRLRVRASASAETSSN